MSEVIEQTTATETPAATESTSTPAVESAAATPEPSMTDKLNDIVAKVNAKNNPAASSGKTAATPAATVTPAAGAQPVIPANSPFTPNLKFKVKDKEHEIPAYMKDVIKDAKTEKEVKELFEKAYGLDGVKEDRATLKKERDTIFQEKTQLETNINTVRKYYQSGDMDSFFAALNIPPEKVLEYALKKAEYYQMPPEQRAQIDNQRNVQLRAEQLESQTQSLTQQLHEKSATQLRDAFEFTMARPEISSVEKSFDAQAGRQGAFRQLVVNHGELAFARSNGKELLTPQQAVDAVMSMYGIKAGSVPSGAAVTAAIPASTPAAMPASTQPATTVIPNIQGKSTSPLKNKPRSIEDLQKIQKEKFG